MELGWDYVWEALERTWRCRTDPRDRRVWQRVCRDFTPQQVGDAILDDFEGEMSPRPGDIKFVLRSKAVAVAMSPSRRAEMPDADHDAALVWAPVLDVLRGVMPEETAELWIGPLVPVDADPLTLCAPDAIAGWVQSRLTRVIDDAAREALSDPAPVRIVAASDLALTTTTEGRAA